LSKRRIATYKNIDEIPDGPGIYTLYDHDLPVYTGMSRTSTRTRLRNHKKDKAFTHFECRRTCTRDARRTEIVEHLRRRKLLERIV